MQCCVINSKAFIFSTSHFENPGSEHTFQKLWVLSSMMCSRADTAKHVVCELEACCYWNKWWCLAHNPTSWHLFFLAAIIWPRMTTFQLCQAVSDEGINTTVLYVVRQLSFVWPCSKMKEQSVGCCICQSHHKLHCNPDFNPQISKTQCIPSTIET